MRTIDERAIKAHADLRFRSEYDYALFEYYRSAKVIAFLERAGVTIRGRVLDAGCGGGGMPLSLAEEAAFVVGIDPADRFQDAGVRLGRERNRGNLAFALADGMYLPFRDRTFDMVLSHAVIEHVADAPLYLRECARVLAPGGHVFLSTAPYLSFAGAHLPRLKVQVPLHLLDRTARRVRDVPVPRPACGLDAQGAGARELFHPGRATGRGQARRPAREGQGDAAEASDRRSRAADRARGIARHLDRPAIARRRRPMAARQPADAGRVDQ